MPRVSVIIPTYNRAKLISDSIQSVLDQTYVDWELIVVDDGSTDETAQVVAEFGEQVTYIYQENAGPSRARNTGFAASQGDFISFLDSDDCMLPNNLETLAALLDARPEASIAYGRYYWFHDNGQISRPDGPTFDGQIFHQLVLEETMMLGTALIRRACVEEIGGFDETVRYQMHWDFYLRLAQAGFTYACCKCNVTLIRVHTWNRSNDKNEMLSWRLNILDRLLNSPELKESMRGLRQQAYYRVFADFAVDYYARGDLKSGAECLNKALEYVAPLSNDLTDLSEKLVSFALTPSIDESIQNARNIFMLIYPTAQMRKLRRKVLGRLNMALAFHYYQVGASKRVWQHVLKAVLYDSTLCRNRGLIRIGLEGLVGRDLVDSMRSWGEPKSSELLERAIQTTSIFISPHLDDAVLSCGGTLAQLAQLRAEVLLVTVFTADQREDAPLSRLAQQFHTEWGGDGKPYRMRRQEDRTVAEHLGFKYKWLDFLPASYRYREILHFDEFYSTGFDPETDASFEQVRDALSRVIAEHPDAIVFAPLGLGYHRDHLLVYQALEEVKSKKPTVGKYYYYEDYPYAATANLQKRLSELGSDMKSLSIDISDTLEERVHMIRMYASQVRGLFSDPEQVFDKVLAYATRVGSRGKPRERFWTPKVNSRRERARSIQFGR